MKWTRIVACILAALWTQAESSARNGLRLLDEATVRSNNVLLSELLPLNASAELKSVAQKIVLGRAPEPGSFRVFDATDVERLVPVDTELDVPASIIVRREGWPLNLESVRRAVEQSQPAERIDWNAAQINGPADFTTLAPDPKLDFVSVTPEDHALLVLLRCRQRAACGTFAVEVTPVDSWLNTDRGLKSATSSDITHNFARAARGFSGPDLVRPGCLALLVIEERGLRISEPVMPGKRVG